MLCTTKPQTLNPRYLLQDAVLATHSGRTSSSVYMLSQNKARKGRKRCLVQGYIYIYMYMYMCVCVCVCVCVHVHIGFRVSRVWGLGLIRSRVQGGCHKLQGM